MVILMAQRYSLSEAAKFLKKDIEDIEKLIASEDLDYEVVDQKYLIPKKSLLKVRMNEFQKNSQKNKGADDSRFVQHFEDFVEYHALEIVEKIEESINNNRSSIEDSKKLIAGKIEYLQESIRSIADMELEEKASENLSKLMESAVEKVIKESGMGNGKIRIEKKDLDVITGNIEQVLEKKLNRQKDILKALKILETRIVTGDDKILKSIQQFRNEFKQDDIKSRIDRIANYINRSLTEYVKLLRKERSEIRESLKKVEELKPAVSGGVQDPGSLHAAVKELKEEQKKARKIMLDLNVNLQKSLGDKIDEIKSSTQIASQYVEEMKKLLPEFRKLIEKKLGQINKITDSIESLRENFTLEGQENVLDRLEEVKKSIENSDVGKMIPHIDEKFREYKRSIEQVFVQLGGRQQKAISERMERIKVPRQVIDSIYTHVKEIEVYFNELSENQQKNFDQLIETIEHTATKEEKSEMEEVILERLNQFQESLESFQEKIDMHTILDAVQESMDQSLGGLKESQESFQKIMVNLNINNQKALVEKLQQLDRLNELVAMQDSVDEISEQMQTFEAIMADINQLVDERLQAISNINEQISALGGSGISPETASKISELGELVEDLGKNFSMNAMLRHFQSMLDELGDDLKQNQEAAQKILVNLNVNSQKWLMDYLDKMGENFDLLKEARDQFDMIETIIPNISEMIDYKLRNLSKIRGQTDSVISTHEMSESLAQIQRVLENEAKSIRHTVESTQKIIVNLANNNKQLMLERMNSVGLSGAAIEEIARKNQEIFESIVGKVEPGRSIISRLENLELILESIKENVNTEHLLEKVVEFLNYQTNEIQSETNNLAALSSEMREELKSKIEQIQSGISEVKASIDPENIISSMGDVVIEGNEMLKENQIALLNHQVKSFKEIQEKLQLISGTKSGISGSASAGEVLPMIEQLLENQMNDFKQDLDGAHKVLVNLNVNLQKQLLTKIREIISEQAPVEVKLDCDSLVNTLDYLLEEKLSEIKETQEALLSLNLNTQNSLKEKLKVLSSLPAREGEAPSAVTEDLVPALEKMIADTINQINDSFLKASQSLEKLSRHNHNELINKLDSIGEKVKNSSGEGDLGESLPAIRDAMDDIYSYLNEFKETIESLKQNVQLQNPQFLSGKMDELKEFFQMTSAPDELISRIQNTLNTSLEEHQQTLLTIDQRIEYIYELIENMGQGNLSEEGYKIRELFTAKIEETRELERQLVQSFHQMQTVFRKSLQETGGSPNSKQIDKIITSLEETRDDQQKMFRKVEMLSNMIENLQNIPKAAPTRKLELMKDDKDIQEQLRKENTKLKKILDNLRKENINLHNQLKVSRIPESGTSERENQLREMMMEKDRLLEECYLEKQELREQLEKEKRDKYEIIQKYEIEKKELIDSLALERIQREKEKAELELLRSEARKKKWW